MKDREVPVRGKRTPPVDLRGMKSLNELQRREVTAYVELAAETIMEQAREETAVAIRALREELDRDYLRKPRWWRR